VIEADAAEEAREKLKPQVPPGLSVLSEEIISDGRPKTVTAAAETTEAAAIQARAAIPPGAVVVSQTDASAPQFSTITVEAFDEAEALAEARTTASRIGPSVLVKGVTQLPAFCATKRGDHRG
jgi:hypothetical protein